MQNDKYFAIKYLKSLLFHLKSYIIIFLNRKNGMTKYWKHITSYKFYKIIFLFISCHISKICISYALVGLTDRIDLIRVTFDTLLA